MRAIAPVDDNHGQVQRCDIASHSPEVLREDIGELGALIRQAKVLEEKEQEVKVRHLKSLLTERGVFEDPDMKLLIFTEHKDTLDFLAGDGRDGRPMGKLRDWNLTVTQIHGGMKIGDRDSPISFQGGRERPAC